MPVLTSSSSSSSSSSSKKQQASSCWVRVVLISSFLCFAYLFLSVLLVRSSNPANASLAPPDLSASTSIDNIVFGIASEESSWPERKELVRLWWEHPWMRGCVFLEKPPPPHLKNDVSLPPVCAYGDASRFQYHNKGGLRSAIRVARIVRETVVLSQNYSGVQWYVFGDDDTVFFPENLAKTLSKYNHRLWHYIGTNSEVYEQNKLFGFEMAFSGGGFALSATLANILSEVFDDCIERYSRLYGSDERVYSCLTELGVGKTHEPGFHQMDIRGDSFGLLAAHPVKPLVSLHNLDHVNPIFPNKTAIEALRHLFSAAKVDSQRLLHQTVCYDRWFSWTVSVSWGYAVQVFPHHVSLPDAIIPRETFKQWRENNPNELSMAYSFDTREPHQDHCRRPTVFYFEDSSPTKHGFESSYMKAYVNCTYDMASPRKLEQIKVFSQKLNLDIKQLQATRRHCCDVLPSSVAEVMKISIRECKNKELIYMH